MSAWADVSANVTDLLIRILKTPSPTGHTKDIIRLLDNEATSFGFQTEITRKGALLIHVPGKDESRRRFITAHVDTLGGMVKEILPNGRLRAHRIGGYAWNTVEGEYCSILTGDGRSVTGTMILHNTSVHVNREVGETKRADDNMEIVLDAKVKSADDVQALGIEIGDFVAWDPRVEHTENGYIKSRHLDDKASVAVLFGVLQSIVATETQLPHGVDVLISTNEEIGFGGNSNISPDVIEYLAVDMGAVGDGLKTDEHVVSICPMDGSGPYHEGLRRHLTALARQHQIAYALDIYPYYSSDASAAVSAGADVKHALIGPGVANSHAYERTHEDGLRATFELVLAYLNSAVLDE